MSRKCEICGKQTVFGNKVSHAKNRSRRTWIPNLLKLKTQVEGTVKHITICTRCLRSNKAVKV